MEISRPVVKKDHLAKARGEALYVADYPQEGLLHGKILRADRARAKILSVRVPPLPPGYLVVDHSDVPGENAVHIVLDDMPVFAGDTVEYIGDPILMVVGPDEKTAARLRDEIQVEYRDLPPVLEMAHAETAFFEYDFVTGDPAAAFEEADHIFEEEVSTGFQECAYLEVNGIIARPLPGNRMLVHGSMQCPYYLQTALCKALGYTRDQVQVRFDTTGGAFGGKEDYPSILACQVAVAAHKAGGPVRVILDRREDMEATGKRHPSRSRYKVAVKGGKITAMDITLDYNAGAFSTLSMVVLQRGSICCNGVYFTPNQHVHSRALKTNTVPNGAFRGFGAPQVMVAAEMVTSHIARALGEEPLDFKLRNFYKQGDPTSTQGRMHFPVPLPPMVEQIDQISGYRQKRKAYAQPQTGRTRRGIGLTHYFHGAGFTGNGERDIIKAVAGIRKTAAGQVELLTANTDMGQGIMTTLAKIAAKELGIPPEEIVNANPDTDRVPDSGPTVASRSLMVVGELIRRAAARLRAQWKEGEEQYVEERYVHPEFLIPFELEGFRGDAYPAYAWGVVACEVEVDTFTGLSKILGLWGCFDVGTPIDETIVKGQMEGGMVQGIGYATLEQMNYDGKGRIRNNSFSDYIIPTAMDLPHMECILYTQEYPEGPYGAKGAGELPIVGVPAAYTEAVEQALNITIRHIPFTAEDVLAALREKGGAPA